ncbi:MAG: enoyl-CoA hydratase/isomerase family protein [Wenzhouxiangellaceae bacterium]|nr:enoyl-CoA hydratase/isomerase family protein [Wenzhouxiangellaceae bacterium]
MNQPLNQETDDAGVTTLMLDRPDVHNAFNAALIGELTQSLDELAASPPRVLVLSGAGKSFSAGADLGWMRAMADAGEAENRTDSERLAAMFRKLDELPCPTIARVNGAAFGGGVGLISCCDIAVAADQAKFGLTEVRLGLIPATIAPFVIARIGAANARRYMLTGERFDAQAAKAIGLIHETCAAEALDAQVESITDALLASGPYAVAECKQLIRRVQTFDGPAGELDAITAEWIARLRVGNEGQEGLRAFLEKRKPSWNAG